MHVFIRTNYIETDRFGSTPKVFSLDVQVTDTIETVKAKIQDKEGIPSGLQSLLFTGKYLVNVHTLSDYGIQRETTLHLLILHYEVVVKLIDIPGPKTITIQNVTHITKIRDIKGRINDQVQIPPDQQILTFDGRILQNDEKAIGECNIQKGSILHLKKSVGGGELQTRQETSMNI